MGGGVIGLSAAWEAARRGLSIALVDPAPGRGAGWVAAGILAPVSETSSERPTLARLFCAAADRWPAFAARLEAATGLATGFQACGAVAVALCASDREALEGLLAAHRALGREASALSASECRSVVDLLSPALDSGVLVPGDHQVDNRALMTALVEACAGAGVQTIAERAAALELDAHGAVAGVATARGDVVRGRWAVLAAGAWTPQIGGVPAGVLPAVRPVKGHVVRLRAAGGRQVFSHVVSGYVYGRHRYLVARADGSVVVGATVEERGFDTTVQAGALRSLLDDARPLVPSADDWEYVECLAGLRPGSPDGAPFVGATRVPGLLVATGHYRNGLLLAPISAEAIAEHLTAGTVLSPFEAFPPDRSGISSASSGPSEAS